MSQSEWGANTCNRRQARENACEQVTIGFGFTLISWDSSARFVAMQNQSNREITFDAQLKTASSHQKLQFTYFFYSISR